MDARRRPRQLGIDRRDERVHQLGPRLVADPQRRAAAFAIIAVGRARFAVDRRVPYPERALAAHFKRVGYPHDVDCITTAAGALAADRAIAALVGVRRMTVNCETDRAAATGAFETHRHSNLRG